LPREVAGSSSGSVKKGNGPFRLAGEIGSRSALISLRFPGVTGATIMDREEKGKPTRWKSRKKQEQKDPESIN
jgi:hypothetical protein